MAGPNIRLHDYNCPVVRDKRRGSTVRSVKCTCRELRAQLEAERRLQRESTQSPTQRAGDTSLGNGNYYHAPLHTDYEFNRDDEIL